MTSRRGPHVRLVAEGPGRLSISELLAVVLADAQERPATEVRSALLIESVGGAAALARTPLGTIVRHGVKLEPAARVVAAFELARRARAEDVSPHRFATARDLAAALAPRLEGERQEILLVVPLDGALASRRIVEVARGGFAAAPTSLGAVLAPVLEERAPRFAVVHNHPSGDPSPSDDDRAFTAGLATAAALLGVELVDHVIVGAPQRYFSFAREGLLTVASQGSGEDGVA